MNKKENLQYQNTHNKIMTTMIELLETKPLKQITVAELCRLIHINRSTFYEHFPDTQNVVDQIEDYIAGNISAIFQEGETALSSSMLRLLEHVLEYREFYRICFAQGLALPIDQLPGMTRESRSPDYPLVFFHAGTNAVIRHWLDGDCQETPEELLESVSALLAAICGNPLP